MHMYEHNDLAHGCLLSQWWYELHRSGDIDKLFPKRAQTLQALFKLFESPLIAMFDMDDDGIWFMVWLSPAVDGAFFSLWIRNDKRHTKEAYSNLRTAYEAALGAFPVLMGITIQERLLVQHEKLGYSVYGPIPDLFDGKPAWMVVLTRDSYKSAELDKRIGNGN